MTVRSSDDATALPRRVMLSVAYSIIIEGALYSAIAPVVPQLEERFALSESMVGLIVSGYSGGLVVGSLASVLAIRHLEARNAALCGLVAFSVSTAVFSLAPSAGVVLWSRIAQGLCSGLLWTSCTYWLLSAAPAGRRALILGQALSYTFIGTVAGPLLGTVAATVGIAWTYLSVAAVCAVVAASMLTAPAADRGAYSPNPTATRPRGLAGGVAALSLALIVLAGAIAGLLNTQGPLELDRRAFSNVAIGVVFIVSALATIVTGPVVGRISDRAGAAGPLMVGIGAAASCLVVLASGVSSGYVYAAIMVAMTASMFTFYLPAGALLTMVSDRTSWTLSFALALSAVGWGVGETVGALATGGMLEHLGARATSVAAAALVLALAVASGVLLRRWRSFPGLTGPVPEHPSAATSVPTSPI